MTDKRELINQCYKAFPDKFKPQQGVDDPMHCLACNETHLAYEAIERLKHVNPKDFRICYLSVECLSDVALKFLMPRLLDLVIRDEEAEEDCYLESFVREVLSGLIPNKDQQDRFKYYNQKQIKIVICFLELMEKRSSNNEVGAWKDEDEDWISSTEDNLEIHGKGINRVRLLERKIEKWM